MGKHWKRWWPVLPALTALLMALMLPHCPGVTERVFSRGIFRALSTVLGGLTSLIPLSITECLVLALLPLTIGGVVMLVRRVKRSSHPRRIWLKAGRCVGVVLSFGLLLYMLMHGANFYRYPAAELMNLPSVTLTPDRLAQLCADLAEKASHERQQLPEDGAGRMKLAGGVSSALREAVQGYRQLEGTYPFLKGAVSRGKLVMLSHQWSYTGITGMYFPLLCEANVNVDIPPSSLLFTVAHELAHTRGFAREDECNFFAYLSCIHHPSAAFRYSGYLMAYIYCHNALYDQDPELAAQVSARCSDAVRRDLQGHNQYWQQFDTPWGITIERASRAANHAFIQAHGVEEGVYSYNLMVQLVAQYDALSSDQPS